MMNTNMTRMELTDDELNLVNGGQAVKCKASDVRRMAKNRLKQNAFARRTADEDEGLEDGGYKCIQASWIDYQIGAMFLKA